MNVFEVPPLQLEELIARLTPRQMEIVELLAMGHTTREVCTILSIERITFQSHIRNACNRVEADHKMQLVVMFVTWKLLCNGASLK